MRPVIVPTLLRFIGGSGLRGILSVGLKVGEDLPLPSFRGIVTG